MKDSFSLADSKLEVCQERVLPYKNPSWVWSKAINKVMIVINNPFYK